jgi:hypothetical protein
MIDWLARFRRKAPGPLTGGSATRRQKTYTAATGWVYEYVFEGRRTAARGLHSAIEFVFTVSADRRNWSPISVFVMERDVSGRSANECYAIAKMSLFQAFDEREPAGMEREIVVRKDAIAAILTQLGLD